MFKWISWSGMVVFMFTLFLSVHAQTGTTVGGYGELHYNKPTSGKSLTQSNGMLDFHRFVLYFGHHFNNWIYFNSEVEIEHSYVEGGEATGELSIEQAYIHLAYRPSFGIRAGILLVPVGIINPVHEPPTFHGVERPNVEKYLIPTTWREAGAGISGKIRQAVQYELYAMAGLVPEGISGKEGIRSARQKAFESSTSDFAVTGALRYQMNLNIQLGGSFFFSTLEGTPDQKRLLEGASFLLGEVHALWQMGNIQARGLLVYSQIKNVEKILSTFDKHAGEKQLGWYLELAYDIFPFLHPESEQRLFLFGRYEDYDTHFRTYMISRNPDYHRKETTLGITYKPAPNVALKLDYQWLGTAGRSDSQQFNLGMGYNF